MHHKCREILAELGREGSLTYFEEFEFPQKQPLQYVLKDLLEDKVDEKYFIKKDICEYSEKSQGNKVADGDVFQTVNAGTHGYSMGYVDLMQVGNIDTKGHNSLWGRVYDTNGIAPTQNAKGGGAGAKTGLFKIASNTKSGYEVAKDGDGISLSKPTSTTRRGRVGKQVAQTLDTSSSQGILLDTLTKKEYNGLINNPKDTNAQRTSKKTNSREILQILWEEAREKTVSKGEFGKFTSLQQKEILWDGLYSEELCKNWEAQYKLEYSSRNFKKYEEAFYRQEMLREMWKNWKARYSSYRRGLSKQLTGKLDDIVQKLSYENSQTKANMQDKWMRNKSERIWLLRQALSEIQEMGEPIQGEAQSVRRSCRIRKLSPRECSRVQGDFKDMFKFGKASDTKLYEFIGNAMDISTTKNLIIRMLEHLKNVDLSDARDPSFTINSQTKQKSLFD